MNFISHRRGKALTHVFEIGAFPAQTQEEQVQTNQTYRCEDKGHGSMHPGRKMKFPISVFLLLIQLIYIENVKTFLLPHTSFSLIIT